MHLIKKPYKHGAMSNVRTASLVKLLCYNHSDVLVVRIGVANALTHLTLILSLFYFFKFCYQVVRHIAYVCTYIYACCYYHFPIKYTYVVYAYVCTHVLHMQDDRTRCHQMSWISKSRAIRNWSTVYSISIWTW